MFCFRHFRLDLSQFRGCAGTATICVVATTLYLSFLIYAIRHLLSGVSVLDASLFLRSVDIHQGDDGAVDFIVSCAIWPDPQRVGDGLPYRLLYARVFPAFRLLRARIFSRSEILILGRSSLNGRPMSVGKILKALRAAGVARRTVNA